MKKTIAKLWIAALRSGKYNQTSGALHRIDYEGNSSFCGLGVLCDLYQQNNENKLAVNETCPGTVRSYDGSFTFLPERVKKWSGISSALGRIDSHNETSIAVLNDDGFSFGRIAIVIEDHMENL